MVTGRIVFTGLVATAVAMVLALVWFLLLFFGRRFMTFRYVLYFTDLVSHNYLWRWGTAYTTPSP